MTTDTGHAADTSLPSLKELGDDLLCVTAPRRLMTLSLPFAAMASYALFAWLRQWPFAVLSVMALCFVTYGSTSHDLVHHTLRLPQHFNNFLLSLIELLSLRSGTAYRLSHLHHHQHLLATDDIEGSVAHGSLLGAIASGVTMQPRLWVWAWNKHPSNRPALLAEGIGILALALGSVVAVRWTAAPLIYVALVVAGSWLFPLVTVYIPHDASGQTPLARTRLFRGWVYRLVAFDHLYHLEHHLYPAVPHHHWKTLADRLDPYFKRAGL
jgi:beta-carotene hydroxylase